MARYLGKKQAVNADATKEKMVFNKKKLNRAMVGISGNIVFTKTSRWAFYRIPMQNYDFLPRDEQYRLASQTASGLNTLMESRQRPLRIKLMGDSIPVNLDAWREQTVEAAHRKRANSQDFDDFLTRELNYLRTMEFSRKVVLLGVELSRRTDVVVSDEEEENLLFAAMKQAYRQTTQTINSFFGKAVQEISADEERAAKREEALMESLISSSNLDGERATAEEILLLSKKMFYPFMPVPYLDTLYDERIGEGDIVAELSADIKEYSRYLRIRQIVGDEEQTGYRAVLSMRKFPRQLEVPGNVPFFYALNQIGAPFPFFANLTLYPVTEMRRLLDKKNLESKDELKNIAEGDADMPEEVLDSLSDMDDMKRIMAADPSPWVEGSYRIVVEADTLKKLRKFCTTLKQRYSDIGVTLHWSAGDQIQYLLEQMPGDVGRIDSYNQVTTMNHVAASGFNFSSEFGDAIMPMSTGGR